jgi:putative protease
MAAVKKKPKAKAKPRKAKKPAPTRKSAAPKKKAAAKKPARRVAAPKVAARPAPKPRPAPAAPLPVAAPARPGPLPGEEPIGVVTHYYGHLSVAVVRLDTGTLRVGDTVRFLGHTSDFRQKIESLQIEHQPVSEVGRRQEFGMKVKEHVREHDVVYKVTM